MNALTTPWDGNLVDRLVTSLMGTPKAFALHFKSTRKKKVQKVKARKRKRRGTAKARR